MPDALVGVFARADESEQVWQSRELKMGLQMLQMDAVSRERYPACLCWWVLQRRRGTPTALSFWRVPQSHLVRWARRPGLQRRLGAYSVMHTSLCRRRAGQTGNCVAIIKYGYSNSRLLNQAGAYPAMTTHQCSARTRNEKETKKKQSQSARRRRRRLYAGIHGPKGCLIHPPKTSSHPSRFECLYSESPISCAAKARQRLPLRWMQS